MDVRKKMDIRGFVWGVVSGLFLVSILFWPWDSDFNFTDSRQRYRNDQYDLLIIFPKEVTKYYVREYEVNGLNPYNAKAEISFDTTDRGQIPYTTESDHFGDYLTVIILDLGKCDRNDLQLEEEVIVWCRNVAEPLPRSGISHFGEESLRNSFVGYWRKHGRYLFVFNDFKNKITPEEIRDNFEIQFR
ncbi:MAG: hypothetical protein KW806_01190 [Candidatus Yanofskybacteria bacterium]|nr:hypothetical protein [Candidatus Yanofskybacteria bacterium]